MKTRFNWLFLQEFGQQLGCHLFHSKTLQVANFILKWQSNKENVALFLAIKSEPCQNCCEDI